jgi:hypothetical protein
MDRRTLITPGVCLPFSHFASAQSNALSGAINRTARCRMLSQRAVKAFGLAALKLNNEMRDTITEVDSYNRGRSFAHSLIRVLNFPQKCFLS